MTDPGCLRLFNIILNKSFRSMNLFPVKSPSKERSYFNPNAKHSLVKHKLEVWPGYITSIGNFEAGICLVFDSCSKIIRKETVADVLANLFKKNSNRGDFINLAQKQLIGQSVMTSYRYWLKLIEFIYSEKATKFCDIFTLLLTVYTVVKSKVKISQNFVAFSEYMNFT